MADLGFTTEAEMAEDYNNFELVSAGWKKLIIKKTELVDTKAGNGKMLILHNEVQGVEVPTEAGVIIQDRLNIINASEVAQKIGRAALAKITHECMGLPPISDSDKLCGILYEGKVAVKKFKSNKADDNGKYKMLESNEITDYRKAGKIVSQAAAATSDTENIDW